MKNFAAFLAIVLFSSANGIAQSDERLFTFEQFGKSSNRSWSVYAKFEGPAAKNLSHSEHGIYTKNFQKLEDNLYLQIRGRRPADVKSGVRGYDFSLWEDSNGEQKIEAEVPGHGVTPDGVYAFHFRNNDNTGPNESGPKNTNAPGATRHIKIGEYTMTIRVLEAEIINLGENKIPTFSRVNFLITVERND